jgi:hypothetical protein
MGLLAEVHPVADVATTTATEVAVLALVAATSRARTVGEGLLVGEATHQSPALR